MGSIQGVRCKTNLPSPYHPKSYSLNRGSLASNSRKGEHYSRSFGKGKREIDNLSAWSIEEQLPIDLPVSGHSEKIVREVSCQLAPSMTPPQRKGVKTQVSAASGRTGASSQREMIKSRKLTRKRYSEVRAVNVQWEATETEATVRTPPPITTPSKLTSYEAFVTEMKKKKRTHSNITK